MSDESNPPTWPENVLIFSPDDCIKDTDGVNKISKQLKKTEDKVKSYQIGGETKQTYTSEKHFSSDHWAILFKPGTYKDCSFEVGYYVQVAGLGVSAEDVKFISTDPAKPKYSSGPFVKALNKDLKKTKVGTIAKEGSGLALDTFWRSAENFYTDSPMVWAVSQAAPLRRVYIESTLQLAETEEYASGGVLANAVVTGNDAEPWSTNFISQQQWFSRGVKFGRIPPGEKEFLKKTDGGAWNIVYSGCTGSAPKQSLLLEGSKSIVVEEKPKVRTEKPFITFEGNLYKLRVPRSTTTDTTGPHLDGEGDDVRDFNQIKLGIPNAVKDDSNYNLLDESDKKLEGELQDALDQGKDLVLCPGIFFLSSPLVIKHPGQVILGLGLATLVAPKDGSPCIRVLPFIHGVRIAGITLEASVQDSGISNNGNIDGVRSLLEWGIPGVKDEGIADKPGVLTDIFARVGGSNLDRTVSTDVMIRIHSSNVMGDNLWLWRADHMKLRPKEDANNKNFPLYHQTVEGEAQVKNALIVHGDNVNMYGLFCEHTVEDQLIWHGQNGSVVFYQCELPYDVSDENFGKKNFVGYRVHDIVDHHEAYGIGVYCNFTKDPINVATAILHPDKPGIKFHFPYTRFLSNLGCIQSVVNHKGPAVRKGYQGPGRPYV
jgi:hypothetical protein